MVSDGKIADIDPAITVNADDTVDAGGRVLMPGVIDDQVHFREPGLTQKEDLAHASRACAKGGVTSFLEMPNTIPNATTQKLLDDKLAIASKASLVNYGFYIGATPNNVDDLKEVVAANKEARKAAAAEAEVLLKDEQLAFEAWRDSLETVPTIKALRQKAEDVRSLEMDKAMKKLGDGMTKKGKRAVEDLSRGIVNKLLHGPMTGLRCDGSDPDAVNETLTNMEALERMFDLGKEPVVPRRR